MISISETELKELQARRKEIEKTLHKFEINKLKMITAVELHKVLCNLIMSDPYLRESLRQSQRDQAVEILRNSANLSQEQYEENEVILFQVVDTIKSLHPTTPKLYKEAI